MCRRSEEATFNHKDSATTTRPVRQPRHSGRDPLTLPFTFHHDQPPTARRSHYSSTFSPLRGKDFGKTYRCNSRFPSGGSASMRSTIDRPSRSGKSTPAFADSRPNAAATAASKIDSEPSGLLSPNATKSVLYSRVAELIATKGEEAALDYFSAVIAEIMDAEKPRGRQASPGRRTVLTAQRPSADRQAAPRYPRRAIDSSRRCTAGPLEELVA